MFLISMKIEITAEPPLPRNELKALLVVRDIAWNETCLLGQLNSMSMI